MRKDNPHISKRRGGRKASHRKFSLQAFHPKHLAAGHHATGQAPAASQDNNNNDNSAASQHQHRHQPLAANNKPDGDAGLMPSAPRGAAEQAPALKPAHDGPPPPLFKSDPASVASPKQPQQEPASSPPLGQVVSPTTTVALKQQQQRHKLNSGRPPKRAPSADPSSTSSVTGVYFEDDTLAYQDSQSSGANYD